MKPVILIFSAIIFFAACKSNDQKSGDAAMDQAANDSSKFTQIQWQDSVVNFGTIAEGEKALVKFHFKNIGDKPLYIVSVRAGCGCTVPDYTKGAIAPGGEGEVTGEYNSSGNSGPVSKKYS
jgi:hypothetical protein